MAAERAYFANALLLESFHCPNAGAPGANEKG